MEAAKYKMIYNTVYSSVEMLGYISKECDYCCFKINIYIN